MTNKSPPKQVGAQRFYNAIEKGNVGLVAMYISSNTDVTQGFDPKKVWEAWNPTANMEVLNVLLQNKGLATFGMRARRGAFPGFGDSVLGIMSRLAQSCQNAEEPPVKPLVTLRLCSKALSDNHCEPEYYGLVNTLESVLGTGKHWPYPILAENWYMALQMFPHLREKLRPEYIDWFLDMFGPVKVDQASTASGYLSNIWRARDWHSFNRLVPTEAAKKAMFEQYPYSHTLKAARDGYRDYLKLVEIAPWIKV